MASDEQSGRFFVLSGGVFDSEHDAEMLESDPVHLGEAPRCGTCGRFIGGRPWLPPYRAELTLHGSKWGDFAFRGAVGEDFLIATPVAASFHGSGLSGLSGFDRVEVVRVRGTSTAPPDYVHVAVELGGATIDETRSSFRRSAEVECDECHFGGTLDAVHGFELAPESWTGTDIFIAMGLPGTPIVSERFKNWAEKERLTNVRFMPTETFEWDSRGAASTSR
jgi:hypothetical protein